jgi:alcohol dehydrogenase class IV
MDGIATIRYLTTASFGYGAAGLLAEVLAELAIARPLIVTDAGVRAAGITDRVVDGLDGVTWFARTPANPTDAAVAEATAVYADAGCDGVVAIGGGSSIDLAKGVALLATHPGPLAGYAMVNGGLERITAGVAPTIAVPTTAGTGSEVGRAAMINVGQRKLDFISPHLFPARALCDPELTLGLHRGGSAATPQSAADSWSPPPMGPPA